jgi:hypothetical protein
MPKPASAASRQMAVAAPSPAPRPASSGVGDDASLWGCGWYLSSFELCRGVEVLEVMLSPAVLAWTAAAGQTLTDAGAVRREALTAQSVSAR